MSSGHSEGTSTASAASKAVGSTTNAFLGSIAETVQLARGRRAAHRSRTAAIAAEIRDPERYEIVGEHGRGALGRVSRAHDHELGREVAIKELLTRSSSGEKRFLREVQITARLEHPGIVPVYEAGRWPDGKPFYTMRSVSGRPLRDLIVERPVEQRLGLLHHVIAVADAMAYAHGRNIIHRDLKPANVVVGAFGETIVVDWGLAKDLTHGNDDGAAGDRAGRTAVDDQHTAAGAIVGTPAYMAPEQSRGEPVDQRADVFAIGVMLWELCADERPPPRDPQVRRRILHRAGIDRDLVTILDKALEPAPERRYRDASALAADLKSFKAGARIAARHYSLLALLVHWTRRHRALAAAIALLAMVAIAGSVVYVRNITAARELARRSQGAAEAALGELTLRHAETLLSTDPTAALDELLSYHGSDHGRVARIRAEALGRGVALVRGVPHSHNVLWTEVTADGAVLSLGLDGTIARTTRDGRSTVITNGVSRSATFAYAATRHLLAYACDPSDVCLFDASRAARVSASPVLRDVKIVSLALSPDATLLAVLSQGEIIVVDLTEWSRPSVRATLPGHRGEAIAFVDERRVAIQSVTGVEIVPLAGEPAMFSFPDIASWNVLWAEHAVALGTATGQAVVLDAASLHVTARAELCRGRVAALTFLHGKAGGIGYACRSGTVGVWDTAAGTVTPRAQLDRRADDLIATDPGGRYLFAAGGNGAVTVIDLQSGAESCYKGQGYRLVSLTAPTAERPFVVSGDTHGGVRAWPLPTQLARVVATTHDRFNTVVFDAETGAIAATTWLPELAIIGPAGATRSAGPHLPANTLLEPSRTGTTFVAFGLSDLVEVWSSRTMTRTRLVDTGQGSVSVVRFLGDSADFLTSGHDGRLVRWSASGQATEVARAGQPIDRFAVVATGAVVFSTVDGALWRTAEAGRIVALRPAGARIHRIVAAADAGHVYAGDASGEVIAIDTTSWQVETAVRCSSAIHEMAAARDGRTVAISDNDGGLYVGTRDPVGSGPGRLGWTTWRARARGVALTPDGLVVATYSDGMIWLYAPGSKRWLAIPSGATDLARITVAPGGDAAVVSDVEGRMIRIDLAGARQQLAQLVSGEPVASPPHEGQ